MTIYIAIQSLFKIRDFFIIKEKVIHTYDKERKGTPPISQKIPVLVPGGSYC